MDIKEVIEITNKIMSKWMDIGGIAPDSVVDKLDNARLDWIIQLTDCLEIWTDRIFILSEGELLLARANIGAIVEGWLKFFYCVYYEDYKNDPMKNKVGNIIEPNNLSFEQLKQFSRGKLYKVNDEWENWIDSVQRKRNAIHAFNDRDIGTVIEFLNDVNKLKEFIKLIDSHLPYIDDFYLD